MVPRNPVRILLIAALFSLVLPVSASNAEMESLELIRAIATLPGEIAQVGLFEENQQIDLLFEFDLVADTSDTARLTWDVYDRHDRTAYSSEREEPCEPGRNLIRIANAIPVDLGAGTQVYHVYASVRVGDLKEDTQFEIRIESPRAFPGLTIEDVRLEPREDDSIVAQELGSAAIPYTLEIDFRVENIISWARAEVRWLGLTADGFVLDQGIGTTDVDEGFNTFDVDGYLARPPRGSTPEADFSVQVTVFGYFDSVTFPISSLPVSLVGLRAARGVEDEFAFSVGDAYLVTDDGARATVFSQDDSISARMLTGGVTPENTAVFMRLSGGPDETVQDFSMRLDAGVETPAVEFDLPADVSLEPGFYEFTWTVMIGDVLFAERRANFTISDRPGINIPVVIDLPGDAEFAVPLTWEVTTGYETGLIATMLTPDGIVCRLLGNPLDMPLNVNLLADVYESEPATSGIPVDATPLTTEEEEYESVWESVRRAYLGDGKVFVHDYWLYRVGDGQYVFLIATSMGSEDLVAEAYSASDAIRANLYLGE